MAADPRAYVEELVDRVSEPERSLRESRLAERLATPRTVVRMKPDLSAPGMIFFAIRPLEESENDPGDDAHAWSGRAAVTLDDGRVLITIVDVRRTRPSSTRR